MVVKSNKITPSQLDVGYLALFLGIRFNELVLARLARAGMSEVRESHGFLIQHLICAKRSITELATRMGVTQQAGSKMVAELLELGVVEINPNQDRRTKRIRLSAKGEQLVLLTRRTRMQVDSRLIRKLGESRYESLHMLLLECLESLGGLQSIRNRRIRVPR